jgi:hypothetical protein
VRAAVGEDASDELGVGGIADVEDANAIPTAGSSRVWRRPVHALGPGQDRVDGEEEEPVCPDDRIALRPEACGLGEQLRAGGTRGVEDPEPAVVSGLCTVAPEREVGADVRRRRGKRKRHVGTVLVRVVRRDSARRKRSMATAARPTIATGIGPRINPPLARERRERNDRYEHCLQTPSKSPHRALAQRPPLHRSPPGGEHPIAEVIDRDRVRRQDLLGGLIHEYHSPHSAPSRLP